MTVEIKLTRGHVALVDDCDADLAELKWHVIPCKQCFYAVRRERGEHRKQHEDLAMHRVIAERINGGDIPSHLVVDHKNGVGTDNRRENLRLATLAENGRNRRLNRNNTSGFKGVTRHTHANRWKATIGRGGTTKYIGCFVDPLEAHRAYCIAALEYHGDFANFGDDSPFTGWTLADFEKAA